MTSHTRAPTKNQYIVVVRANSALLAEAARSGLTDPVPTCPGWYVATLVAHIGEVQRFWAHQIVTRAQVPTDLPESAYDSCPGLLDWYTKAMEGQPALDAIPAGLVEWFEAATVELVNAFQGIESEEAVWHWSGDNRAIAHMRNQAMEATIHRWDAENAHGAATGIDPLIAADGIDQHFEVQIAAARKWGKPIDGSGETYHFHRTDGEGEWTVVFDGADVSMRHEHAEGDVTMFAPLEDIFLWLWGRLLNERVDARGNLVLLMRYRQLVPTN